MNNHEGKNTEELLQNALQAETAEDMPFSAEELIKEKEKRDMKKKKIMCAAAAAIVILAVPSTVFAARYLKNVTQVIKEINGDQALAGEFQTIQKEDYLKREVSDGFEITLYGVVSGREASDYVDSGEDILPERTYAVVAVSREDGKPIRESEEWFISPLISGCNPAQYNIVTMHGSYVQKIINGVLYRVIECDSIACFANQDLYLAVSNQGPFYSPETFCYSEKTGIISLNEEYQGVHALFSLPLDKSQADEKKAEAYKKKIESFWNGEEDMEQDSNANGEKSASDGKMENRQGNNKATEESTHVVGDEWTVEQVRKNGKRLDDSVKEFQSLGEGMYQYKHVLGYLEDGLEDCVSCSLYLENMETGYAILSCSEKINDQKQVERLYLLAHKSADGTITGMLYQVILAS